MDELIKQLLSFARGMWRFRWPGVLVAWLVALVGVAAVFRIPDQYEASARIYVDTQSILKPLMAGLTVQPNISQQINMLSRTLLSRPNLERLVRMADLDLGAKSPKDQEALIAQLGRKRGDPRCRPRQPLHLGRSGQRPGQGAAHHPVADLHLRRVQPGRQPQGQRHGQDLPGRADPALRGQARGSRGAVEGVSAAQPGDPGLGHRRQGRGLGRA